MHLNKKKSTESIVVLFLLLWTTFSFSQGVEILKKSENLTVGENSSFTKRIDVHVKKNSESRMYPIFYDGELEKVSNLEVFYKKGKRYKAIENPVIIEDDVELDYIASKKVKSLILPPEKELLISYTVSCEELMYFSDLRFFSNNSIDTLSYQINLPKRFHLVYDLVHQDSLNHLVIDSVVTAENRRWNINVLPKKITPDPLSFFGIYRNQNYPFMRTLVVPNSYKENAMSYMNDWYLSKVKNRRGLNSVAISKIDELTRGISNPRQIVEILYNYVRSNFKYVAIEVGMGAFIPTHTNEVFRNREGDCKDLSNFLSEALNYKGVKSDIALAATNTHITDCDFPSLSSANHVICIAYIDRESILLDPTDPIHVLETPVQSLQGRSILVITNEGGEWSKVNNFISEQNLIEYRVKLKANSDGAAMHGKFNATYNGISGNFIKREILHKNEEEIQNSGSKFYEATFGNQTIADFKIKNTLEKIETEGVLSIAGKVYNDSDDRILFLDFLPPLIENESRDELLLGSHFGSNFTKKVAIQIELEEPFEHYDPIEYSAKYDSLSFNMTITNPIDSIVEVNYEFICNSHSAEIENIESINKTLKLFKKIINDPIILKAKY